MEDKLVLPPNSFLSQYCDVMKVKVEDDMLNDFLIGYEVWCDELVEKLVKFTGIKKTFWINARQRFLKYQKLVSATISINYLSAKKIWDFDDFTEWQKLTDRIYILRKELYEL